MILLLKTNPDRHSIERVFPWIARVEFDMMKCIVKSLLREQRRAVAEIFVVRGGPWGDMASLRIQ